MRSYAIAVQPFGTVTRQAQCREFGTRPYCEHEGFEHYSTRIVLGAVNVLLAVKRRGAPWRAATIVSVAGPLPGVVRDLTAVRIVEDRAGTAACGTVVLADKGQHQQDLDFRILTYN